MTVEGGVRLVTGSAVLLTVAMSHPKCLLYVSESMLFVTTFVGVMMFQSAFTGFCPSASLMRKLGLKDAGATRSTPT